MTALRLNPKILMICLILLFYVCSSGRYDIYEDEALDYFESKDNGNPSPISVWWLLLILSYPLVFLWINIFHKLNSHRNSSTIHAVYSVGIIVLIILMFASILPLFNGMLWLISGCPDGMWK
jgi:hypothetical protein